MIGGPYSLLQVWAWGKMLVSYSQNDGLVQGAKDTFSGEKPCELCRKISVGRKLDHSENEPVIPFFAKLSARQLQEMLPGSEIRIIFPRPSELPPVTFAATFYACGVEATSPPTPPPRVVA